MDNMVYPMFSVIVQETLEELHTMTPGELVKVAHEHYGLDWVTEQDDITEVIDACISIEQQNFFG